MAWREADIADEKFACSQERKVLRWQTQDTKTRRERARSEMDRQERGQKRRSSGLEMEVVYSVYSEFGARCGNEQEQALDCKRKRRLWNGRVWSLRPWNHGNVPGRAERSAAQSRQWAAWMKEIKKSAEQRMRSVSAVRDWRLSSTVGGGRLGFLGFAPAAL